MAGYSNDPQNADLQFTADLQDNVSPTADQIEKKLKQLGASKQEIKMFLTAYDQATPKIKQVQEQMKRMPKDHMINIQTNADQAHEKLNKLRELAKAPITVTLHVKDDIDEYINRFKMKFTHLEYELKNSLRNMPITGSLLGAGATATSMLSSPFQAMTGLPTAGVGLGAAGGLGAMSAFMAKSFELNSNMEQNMAQLTQLLKSPTAAQGEMRNVTTFATHTPFNMPDVLASDIRLRAIGVNPANKALGLPAAGNLAAGGQVPLNQAQGAISAASLGYFEQLNTISGRNIRQSDFTYGGRYSGKTYEQAIQDVLRQYTGALQTQTQTFKGLMTNIQDVIQQKFVMPVGQPLFQQARSMESGIAGKLGSNQFQLSLSREVDKLQQGLIKVFDLVQQGAGYFKRSLEDPLKSIASSVIQVGSAFGKAFGGTVLTGVQYLGEALATIIQPIAAISAKVPIVAQLAGVVKALHMFGVSTNTGLGDMLGGLTHFDPGRMVTGLREATSLAAKLGLYLTAKSFLDMKNANDQLNHSFRSLGSEGGDELAKLKIHFDELIFKANALGKSVPQLKAYGSQMAEAVGANRQVDPHGRLLGQSAYYGGLDVARLSYGLGMGGSETAGLAAGWAKTMQAGKQIYQQHASPEKVMYDVNNQIYQAAEQLSKTLGISLNDAAKMAAVGLQQFRAQLAQTHMLDPRGASTAAGLNSALAAPGAMTAGDYAKYGGPQELTAALLTNATAPGADVLKAAMRQRSPIDLPGFLQSSFSRGGLGAAFSFNTNTPNLHGAHTADILSTFRGYSQIDTGNRRAQASLMQAIGPDTAKQLGIHLPQFENVLSSTYHIPMMNQGQINRMTPQQDAQMIVKLNDALSKSQGALQDVNQKITEAQNDLAKLNIAAEQAGAAMAKFQLATEKQRWAIDSAQIALQKYTLNALNPLQRALAAVSQQMADYQQKNIVPVQRAQEDWNQVMLRTSNALEDVSFKLGVAQFNMGKFHDGMLVGENALTSQIHSLDMYTERLNMLKIMNMGLEADLTKTTFKQGFTSVIKPLMGFSLEREIAISQERQQFKQAQFDTTYGNQHWQLDRAARPLFQRMEMPFDQRMKGILNARSIIDTGTLQTRDIQNLQYQEQLKARLLQEQMYKATVGERPLQDKTYELNKQMYGVQRNISLKSDAIAKSQLAIQEQQLPLQHAMEHIQNVNTIKQAVIDTKMAVLQAKLGSLTDAIPQLHGLLGGFSDNLNKAIVGGDASVIKHLPDVARSMGLSATALQTIAATLGGRHGGPGQGGDPSKQPSLSHGPGPIHGALNAITGLLNPLTWAQTIADAANNVGKLVTHIGLVGGIAAVAAGGLALLETANVAHYAGAHVVGSHIMPRLASRAAGMPAEKIHPFGESSGFREHTGAFLKGWASKMLEGAPKELLSRPFLYAYQALAKLPSFAAGSAVAHLIPGIGPLISPFVGAYATDAGEAGITTHGMSQGSGLMRGRGILTRAAVHGLEQGAFKAAWRTSAAFEEGTKKGLLRLSWEVASAIPKMLLAPFVGLGKGAFNVLRDTISKIRGDAGTAASVVGGASDVFKEGTRGTTDAKPLWMVLRKGDGMGANAADFTDASKLKDIFKASVASARGAVGTAAAIATDPAARQGLATVAKDLGKDVTQGAKDRVQAAKDQRANVQAQARNVAKEAKNADVQEKAARTQEIAGSREARSAEEHVKGSNVLKEAAKAEGEHVSRFGKVTGFFGDHIGRMGRIAGRFAGAVAIFDLIPGKLGDKIRDFGKIIEGKFLSAIDTFKNAAGTVFKDAVDNFKGIINDLRTVLSHLPGLHSLAPDASKVGRAAGDATSTERDVSKLERALVDNPHLKAMAEAARNAGAKGLEWAGKFFKFAGVAGGALSFLPAGSDIAKGKIAKGIGEGANAATYFLPGVGAVRILQDALVALGVIPKPGSSSPTGRLQNVLPPGMGGNTSPLQYFEHFFTNAANDPAGRSHGRGPNPRGSMFVQPNDASQAVTIAYHKWLVEQEQKTLDALFRLNKISVTDRQRISQQFFTLSKSDQQKFLHDSNNLQIVGFKAALTGPQGLQDFLNSQNTALTNHYNSRNRQTAQFYTNESQTHVSGYNSIGKITGHALGKLKSAIDDWSKKMGLPLAGSKGSVGSAISDVAGSVGSIASAAVGGIQSVLNFAHGGVVKADPHKIGPGRVVRMVEEGHPEVVIPLAPHRRERAKSLINETKGLLAMSNGGTVPGYAHGGTVVGASVYGPPGVDPTVTSDHGAYNWPHHLSAGSIARLHSADAGMWKHLKPGSLHTMNLPGGPTKYVRVEDYGTGGGPVQGHRRSVDLWWETAKHFGIRDYTHWTGLVRLDGHANGGHVHPRIKALGAGHLAPRVNAAGQIIKHGDKRTPGFAVGGYVWPYGPGISSGRIDEGWDMGGSGPIAAIGDTGPLMQGQPNWPGTGQGFYYQLKSGIRAGQYVYNYENIQRLKPLGYQAKAGEVLANLLPGYPDLEAGWATSTGAPTSQGRYHEGVPQPEGYDFQRFLMGLAHGKLIGGGTSFGGVPVTPIDLPKISKIAAGLIPKGIVGNRMFEILQHARKKWQKHLNSQTAATNLGGGIPNVSLSGPVEKQVFQFMTAAGFNKTAIAGMLGNAVQESDMNPNDAGGGLWQQISNFGSGSGGSLLHQMQVMLPQIRGLQGALNSARSPGDAATIFMQQFERPAVATENLPRRIAGANAAFAQGYAGGIDYVPRDGTHAILHQGERVQTAAEAHSTRQVRQTGWGTLGDMFGEVPHWPKKHIDSLQRLENILNEMLKVQKDTLLRAMMADLAKVSVSRLQGQMKKDIVRSNRMGGNPFGSASDEEAAAVNNAIADAAQHNIPDLIAKVNADIAALNATRAALNKLELTMRDPKKLQKEINHIEAVIKSYPTDKALHATINKANHDLSSWLQKIHAKVGPEKLITELQKLQKDLLAPHNSKNHAEAMKELKALETQFKNNPGAERLLKQMMKLESLPNLTKAQKEQLSKDFAKLHKIADHHKDIEKIIKAQGELKYKHHLEAIVATLKKIEEYEKKHPKSHKDDKLLEKTLDELGRTLKKKDATTPFEKQLLPLVHKYDKQLEQLHKDEDKLNAAIKAWIAEEKAKGVSMTVIMLALKTMEQSAKTSITTDQELTKMIGKLSTTVGTDSTTAHKDHQQAQKTRQDTLDTVKKVHKAGDSTSKSVAKTAADIPTNHRELIRTLNTGMTASRDFHTKAVSAFGVISKAEQEAANYYRTHMNAVTSGSNRDSAHQSRIEHKFDTMITHMNRAATRLEQMKLQVNNNIVVNSNGTSATVSVNQTMPQNP